LVLVSGLEPPTKITKTLVEHLSAPASGQVFVRDSILKGFAVRVTANRVHSFVVEKRIDGRVKQLTLGRYPMLSAEQPRTEAHKVLGKVARGMSPIAEREHARLKGVTLKNAFEDWQKRPLAAITKALVACASRRASGKA